MTGLIEITRGDGPIVAVAIHDGHDVRPDVASQLALTPVERLREEDPYTGLWTGMAQTRIVGLRSRFEVDLNRRRHRCVYQSPSDAWGLNVWREPLGEELVEHSKSLYDQFYQTTYELLSDMQRRYGTFFVYDLHAYGHRRDGPNRPPADAIDNPQVNVCTGGMDLERCEPLVQSFIDSMRAFDFPGGTLDVRRNVRFRATRFSRWVHENFPGSGVSLGIEVKKFFMDEWTGELFPEIHASVGAALASTVNPIRELLTKMN